MYGNCTTISCKGSGNGADYAQSLANWAKSELLKEKVKKRIDAKYGAGLEKTADLIVEVIETRAKTAEAWDDVEERLSDAFTAMRDGEAD